jgi:hypothetical protein
VEKVVADLPRAAYLISHGESPIRSEMSESGRVVWVFDWTDKTEQLSQYFFEAAGDAGAIKRFMGARAALLREIDRAR